MTSKTQKSNPRQQQLQEYLSLKPSRAVERLLQQNDFASCFQLYNLLQQNVKANTSQLRSVLYSNHENLYQCSKMIGNIQEFAQKVQTVQNQIDLLLKTKENQDLHYKKFFKYDQQDPIRNVENLLHNNCFSQALEVCKKVINQSSQIATGNENSNLYYLAFLKVQIVEKLESYLQETSLTHELIKQAIEVLQKFMSITSVQELTEIIEINLLPESQRNLQIDFIDNDQVTILDLLQKKYVEKQQLEREYPLSEDQILQVIFKFKLLTIKQSSNVGVIATSSSVEVPNSKTEYLYKKIYNYFSDLLKILENIERSQPDNNENAIKRSKKTKLYEIFTKNIENTVFHISEIFIVNTSKRSISTGNGKNEPFCTTLTFENQLYQKLLESEQFVDVLRSLQTHFEEVQKEENRKSDENKNQLLDIIKNLWRDFYQQMLEIISQNANPLLFYKLQANLQLPQELKKFSVVQYSKVTTQKLNAFKNQMRTFFTNFAELLNKSKNSDEKKAIFQYFFNLKIKIQQQLSREIIQIRTKAQGELRNRTVLNKKAYQHAVKEYILLDLLIQSYNREWQHQFKSENALYREIQSVQKFQLENFRFNIQKLKGASQNNDASYQIINNYLDFKVRSNHLSNSQYIQKWQIQLDNLFGCYSSVAKQNSELRDFIKNLILALIKTKLSVIQ